MARHMKMFLSKGNKMSMSKVSRKAGSTAGSVTMGYGKSHGMKKPKVAQVQKVPKVKATGGR